MPKHLRHRYAGVLEELATVDVLQMRAESGRIGVLATTHAAVGARADAHHADDEEDEAADEERQEPVVVDDRVDHGR